MNNLFIRKLSLADFLVCVKLSQSRHLLSMFIIATLALALNSCATTNPKDYLGRWKMEAIQYEDGSQKALGGSNAIVFEPDAVIEEIEGFGKRRYSYHSEEDTLTLKAGEKSVQWVITERSSIAMQILTPIGTYIVTRE